MQASLGLGDPSPPSSSGKKPRAHYRHQVRSLVYIALNQGNGGIIRNLSQDGCAIQAVAALHQGESLPLRFELHDPKAHFDLHAHVAWANATGQAGLRFHDLDAYSRRLLNGWIFFSLLSVIEQTAPGLLGSDRREDLILSPAPILPIRPVPVAPPDQPAVPEASTALSFPWWPRPISTRSVAVLMDGLVLLSAVLTFFCGFLAVARRLPAWPVALALGLGAAGVFTGLYWFLFAVIGRGTAGVRLARIAVGGTKSEITKRDEEARFR
jgi:hypothetical protein